VADERDHRQGGNEWAPGFVYVASGGGTVANLNGITTYTQDPATGALSFVTFTPNANVTTFFEINHALKVLYVSNESGAPAGGVTSYKMNADGSLTLLNFVAADSPNTGGPSYVVLDPTRQYLLTASWGGFYISCIKLNSDGSLGAITGQVNYSGNLGPDATQQLGAHAHMIKPDPSGKYLLVNNLGQDRTYIYRLNNGAFGTPNNGTFTPGPQPFVESQPGSGPRHFAFHPDGEHLYSLNEVNSTLNVYYWSSGSGTLTLRNTFSTLPEGYVNAQSQGLLGLPEIQGSTNAINTAGEIAVSQDGNYVYASNRTFDSIATLSVKDYGPDLFGVKPKWTWIRGETPRQFSLSPDGQFMYVGGQNSYSITVFSVDTDTGDLKVLSDQYIGVQSPFCITFSSCVNASCSAVAA
jgi:6-phosphogluconolactonase